MIQVYTGNGKGKTCAAFGLALRASGAGLKVFIGQFVKEGCFSETMALKKLRNIDIEQFGNKLFIKRGPKKRDIESAKRGFKKIQDIISCKIYDVVILDEINVAIKKNLLNLKEVINLIQKTPKKTELILTGRHAHPEVIKIADLVSEIKEIKHYFKKGVKARRGIEY